MAAFLALGFWWWHARSAQASRLQVTTASLTDTNTPLQIIGTHDGIYILAPDGSVWVWGDVNSKIFPFAATPNKTPLPHRWKSIESAVMTSVGIRDDGTLWNWGRLVESESNNIGRTFYYTAEPAPLSNDPNWTSASLDLNAWFGVGVKTEGALWGWGDNRFRTLGGDRAAEFKTQIPVQLDAETNWATVMAHHQSAFALKADGTLWAWGFLNGNVVAKPALVSSDTNWISLLEYGHALNRAGEVWDFGGFNQPDGAKSISNAERRDVTLLLTNATPRKFGYAALDNILMLYHIKDDGTLWDQSHAGLTPSVIRKPHQIGKRTDWVQLWSAAGACLGLTADNTLWHWGHDLGAAPEGPTRIQRMENKVRKLFSRRVPVSSPRPPFIETPRPLLTFRASSAAVVEPPK